MRHTKRRDLIKLLEDNGWEFLRHGGNHDIYTDGRNIEPVSHSKEIWESVAKSIIARRGLKKGPIPRANYSHHEQEERK